MWQINGLSSALGKTSSSLKYKLVLRTSSQCSICIRSMIEQYFPFYLSNRLRTHILFSWQAGPRFPSENTITHSTPKMCSSVDPTGVSQFRKLTAFGKRNFLTQTSKDPDFIMKSWQFKEKIQYSSPSPPELYMHSKRICPSSSFSHPKEKNLKTDPHANSWKKA